MMREFIYQESEKGCSLACLRMALIEASGQRNYKYLYFEKHPPYNLNELCMAAKKEGANLEFFKINDKEKFDFSTNVPMMATIIEGGRNHLVYIPKEKKDKLLIYDPAAGPKWVKKETFLKEWSNVIGKITSISKQKCPYKKPKICSFWNTIPSLLCAFLSFVSLFGCFYLMKNDSNYVLSLGLLAGSALFEILSRFLMIHEMKRFDKKWIDRLSLNPNHIKSQYQHYCSFKKIAFSNILSTAVSLLIAISMTILFGFNNPLFFISVFSMIAYIAISSMFLHKYIAQKKIRLEENENDLFTSKPKPETIKRSIRSLTSEGYKIASLLGNEKIIGLIVIAVLSIIPLLNQENIILNYYLLYFSGLYAVSEASANIFEFIMDYKIREREKMYFYEYFAKDEF